MPIIVETEKREVAEPREQGESILWSKEDHERLKVATCTARDARQLVRSFNGVSMVRRTASAIRSRIYRHREDFIIDGDEEFTIKMDAILKQLSALSWRTKKKCKAEIKNTKHSGVGNLHKEQVVTSTVATAKPAATRTKIIGLLQNDRISTEEALVLLEKLDA